VNTILLLTLITASPPPVIDCGNEPFTDVHRWVEVEEYMGEVWVWDCARTPGGYGIGLGYVFETVKGQAEWDQMANLFNWFQKRYPKQSTFFQIWIDYCLKSEDNKAVEAVRPSRPDKVRTEHDKN
jgi:hypothetical protein